MSEFVRGVVSAGAVGFKGLTVLLLVVNNSLSVLNSEQYTDFHLQHCSIINNIIYCVCLGLEDELFQYQLCIL